MYIVGLVIPVPEDREKDYHCWAASSAQRLRALGCLSVTEAWEDFVPDGKITDFRQAVAAQPGEKIVFAWQVWPDRACMQKAEQIMANDPSYNPPTDLPFDQSRLIMGCFDPISGPDLP